jgi:hypothetical protein
MPYPQEMLTGRIQREDQAGRAAVDATDAPIESSENTERDEASEHPATDDTPARLSEGREDQSFELGAGDQPESPHTFDD